MTSVLYKIWKNSTMMTVRASKTNYKYFKNKRTITITFQTSKTSPASLAQDSTYETSLSSSLDEPKFDWYLFFASGFKIH